MNFAEVFTNIPVIAIVLFAVGVVLMVSEMFMSGFGIAGISALIAFILAVVFAADSFIKGLIYSAIIIAVIAIIVILFLVLLSKGKMSSKFVLKMNNSNDLGFSSSADPVDLVGKTGIAQTILRPAGKALIGDKVYDVVSEGLFVSPGDEVIVDEVTGNRIVVKPRILVKN